jgi:hypothetical protein
VSNPQFNINELPVEIQDHAIHLALYVTKKAQALGLPHAEQMILGQFISEDGKKRDYEIIIKDMGETP